MPSTWGRDEWLDPDGQYSGFATTRPSRRSQNQPPQDEPPQDEPPQGGISQPGPTEETGVPDVVVQSEPPDPAPEPPPFIDVGPGGNYVPGSYTPSPIPGGTAGDVTREGSGYDPDIAPWEVTPEQTVRGQLEDFLDPGNPMFDIARENAMRAHGARGGQNTALAAGMGELAVMNQAFQVAAADAAIFARSAEFNAAMKNQFGLAEQQFVHNALLSEQNFQQAMMLQQEQIRGQFAIAQEQIRGELAVARERIRGELQSIQAAAHFQNWNAQNQFEREWQIFQNQQRSNYVGQMMTMWAEWQGSAFAGGFTPEQMAAASDAFFHEWRSGLDLINSFTGRPASPGEYWGGEYWRWPGGG